MGWHHDPIAIYNLFLINSMAVVARPYYWHSGNGISAIFHVKENLTCINTWILDYLIPNKLFYFQYLSDSL